MKKMNENKESESNSIFNNIMFDILDFNKSLKNNFAKALFEVNNNNTNYNYNNKIYEKCIEDGIYNIIPKHCENRVLDIDGGSTQNYANLQIFENNNSKSQKFEIKYDYKNKNYTIKCLCSNKFLTVDIDNNENIIQYEENQQINQKWNIVRKENSYEIISELNNYLMNVDDFGDNSGTNVSCKQRNGYLNQKFQFVNKSL